VAEIIAVSVSDKRGVPKRNVSRAELREDFGIVGDAHAAPGARQVSLLAEESIKKMRGRGLDVGPGDFAENITTRGLDLPSLPVGTVLRLGGEAVVRVSQIGKECRRHCAIYQQAGDCVMPTEGIFVEVKKGGPIVPGDSIEVADE